MSLSRLGRLVALLSVSALVAIGITAERSAPAFAADCGGGTAYSGSGTTADPYLVSEAAHLIYLSANPSDWDKHFEQTKDVDLENCDWTPIAPGFADDFTGTYDGRGNSILGLLVVQETGSLIGLFGNLQTPATVRDLNLVEVDIRGGAYVGSLVGRMESGTINRVGVTGSVRGAIDTGGLVGYVSGGSINDSYSRATVTAQDWPGRADLGVDHFGGLVGDLAGGSIAKSYSTGLVSDGSDKGATDLGGLTGGSNGSATDSFWDTQASGQASSDQGTGKTTAEMTSFSTFDDADWGIVEGWEAFSFDSPTKEWGICAAANDGYPFLLSHFSQNPCSEESGGSNEQTSSTGDSDSGVPGIYLTVKGRSGDTASGSLIGFGGFAVAPNAPYLLTLRPVQEGAAQTVLARGVMDSGGHLEDEVTLGVLTSGSSEVVFVSRDRTGALLTLANVVVVNQDGRFQSITPEELQPRIR